MGARQRVRPSAAWRPGEIRDDGDKLSERDTRPDSGHCTENGINLALALWTLCRVLCFPQLRILMLYGNWWGLRDLPVPLARHWPKSTVS